MKARFTEVIRRMAVTSVVYVRERGADVGGITEVEREKAGTSVNCCCEWGDNAAGTTEVIA